ncbi:cobalt-zinc-cadmium efflux system outer membrane protein [Rhodanobacter sp. ANJX3]|uniref:TolC family protein n=1 Tax=Rhodanobacter sp. ANJX3 TaxID=2723083 RepID=UPI00160F78C5|nr:TolC family protein [Rhodanobacter sp. ANJX3]MBB5360495.1 cobalt-zinc-cadmium efflux system outer membrane protein [Rhodanobacter sp. ANJX3]
MSVLRSVPLGAVLLFASALGATPSALWAATPVGTPTAAASPRLRDALARVWKASPEVEAARAELDAARARALAAAQPIYNPSLSLDAENADVDRRTVGVSLALDLSGKRVARASQGDAEVRVSEAGYDLLRRDVAARWLKAWSTAALAQKQSALGQRRLRLMQRFDDLAAQRLKVGDISSPERDLAALALSDAQLQQANLISDEASARASLMAISGDRASDDLLPLPDDLLPAVESVTARPVDELPELHQAQARQASAEAGVQVARRARIPDPTLSLTGGRVRSGALSERVIGVSVSVPLPVFNTGRADVAAAQSEADAAAAGVRARQFSLRAGLQEAQARYTALRDASAAFRRSRAAAFEDRTALLERLWAAGEITTSDYLVQLKQSLDTALSGDELQSRTWQTWFDYLTAAGRLTDWLDGRTQDASR